MKPAEQAKAPPLASLTVFIICYILGVGSLTIVFATSDAYARSLGLSDDDVYWFSGLSIGIPSISGAAAVFLWDASLNKLGFTYTIARGFHPSFPSFLPSFLPFSFSSFLPPLSHSVLTSDGLLWNVRPVRLRACGYCAEPNSFAYESLAARHWLFFQCGLPLSRDHVRQENKEQH